MLIASTSVECTHLSERVAVCTATTTDHTPNVETEAYLVIDGQHYVLGERGGGMNRRDQLVLLGTVCSLHSAELVTARQCGRLATEDSIRLARVVAALEQAVEKPEGPSRAWPCCSNTIAARKPSRATIHSARWTWAGFASSWAP